MCFTRQKLYTCGCLSVPRKEMCIDAARTWPVVCAEPELKPPHVSYFPCYSCIRAEVMAEKEAAQKEKAQKEMEMEAQAKCAEEALENVEKRDWQKSGGRAWGKSTWGKGSEKGGGKKLDGGV
jgi:hypothetical protein